MLSNLKMLKNFKKQRGAFLVIALILLIVLSALGIASMSQAYTSLRVSRNYSKLMQARNKALSMAYYAKRILESYPDGKWPGPATCNSTATCNVIDNTFPQNGRPVLVWTSGLGSTEIGGSAQSDQWWTAHGFAYEGAFSGSGNARVIVSLLGAETNQPYKHTYRIVGYATDSGGSVRATATLFHTWKGYRPDPYPNYRAAPAPNTCASGCPYGQCCSSGGSCSTTQSDCETGTGAYDPPGWLCTDYFVTGLGYNATTCDNPVSKILDIWASSQVMGAQAEIEAWYNAHGSWPTSSTGATSFSYDATYPTNPSFDALYFYACDQSNANSFFVELNPAVTGQSGGGVVLYVVPNAISGEFTWSCRQYDNSIPNVNYLPPYCGTNTSAAGICDCTSCGGPVIQ